MQLKVLSWNIWCDCDFEKVSEFLRSANADIVGLQEIVPSDKKRDVVTFLSGLGYHHAVSPVGALLDDGRMLTSGVFSKYPIQKSKTHPLSEDSRRDAVEAQIKVDDTVLYVFSFHLKHTHQQESPLQNLQAENLIRVLPRKGAIILADLNATPEMTPIKRMREMLTDTDPASLPTLNAPLFDCPNCNQKSLPLIRLDYIFVSKDLKTHSFKVEDGRGSDHLPVSVILEV